MPRRYNVKVNYSDIDPDGGLPFQEGVKANENFDSFKAAVEFSISSMPVITEPNVGYSKPYETQVVDDSLQVWDSTGPRPFLTEAIITRDDGEFLSEEELRYLEDAVYDEARRQNVKTIRKAPRNTYSGSLLRNKMRRNKKATKITHPVLHTAADFSGQNWSVDVKNGMATGFWLHDPMGWRWNGDAEDIFLFLARIGRSSVSSDFLNEVEGEPELEKALSMTMLKFENDRKAILQGYYSISGDNRVWNFGEVDQDMADRLSERIREDFHDREGYYEDLQNLLADRGVNISKVSEKDVDDAIGYEGDWGELGVTNHETAVLDKFADQFDADIDYSGPAEYAETSAEVAESEELMYFWSEVADEFMWQQYYDVISPEVLEKVADKLAAQYGRHVEPGEKHTLNAPDRKQQKLPLGASIGRTAAKGRMPKGLGETIRRKADLVSRIKKTHDEFGPLYIIPDVVFTGDISVDVRNMILNPELDSWLYGELGSGDSITDTIGDVVYAGADVQDFLPKEIRPSLARSKTAAKGRMPKGYFKGFHMSDMVEFELPDEARTLAHGKIVDFDKGPEEAIALVSVKLVMDQSGEWHRYHDRDTFVEVPVSALSHSTELLRERMENVAKTKSADVEMLNAIMSKMTPEEKDFLRYVEKNPEDLIRKAAALYEEGYDLFQDPDLLEYEWAVGVPELAEYIKADFDEGGSGYIDWNAIAAAFIENHEEEITEDAYVIFHTNKAQAKSAGLASQYHHCRTLLDCTMQQAYYMALESEGQEVKYDLERALLWIPEGAELSEEDREAAAEYLQENYNALVDEAFNNVEDDLLATLQEAIQDWTRRIGEGTQRYLDSRKDLSVEQKEAAFDMIMDPDDSLVYLWQDEASSGIGTWDREPGEEPWGSELPALGVKGEDILAAAGTAEGLDLETMIDEAAMEHIMPRAGGNALLEVEQGTEMSRTAARYNDRQTEREIRKWMTHEVEYNLDDYFEYGEPQYTKLAEQAAWALDPHDTWLDDEQHPVWDIALEVLDRYANHGKKRQSGFAEGYILNDIEAVKRKINKTTDPDERRKLELELEDLLAEYDDYKRRSRRSGNTNNQPKETKMRRRNNNRRVARQFGQRGLLRRNRPGALSGVGKKIQELQEQLEAGEISPDEYESFLEELEAQQRHSRAARVLIARARRAAPRRAAVEPADVVLLQNAVKQLGQVKDADHAVRMLRDIIDAAGEMKRELEG